MAATDRELDDSSTKIKRANTKKGAKSAAGAVLTARAVARRDTLNLRVPAAERYLIDRAAASAGKTRTDFILEAARKAAESELLDRAIMAVGPQAYDEFLQRLDAPAQPNERLRKTMQTPPPWNE